MIRKAFVDKPNFLKLTKKKNREGTGILFFFFKSLKMSAITKNDNYDEERHLHDTLVKLGVFFSHSIVQKYKDTILRHKNSPVL